MVIFSGANVDVTSGDTEDSTMVVALELLFVGSVVTGHGIAGAVVDVLGASVEDRPPESWVLGTGAALLIVVVFVTLSPSLVGAVVLSVPMF